MPKLQIGRKETVAVAVAVVLVVAAFVVPHLHLGIVTPLINATPERFRAFAGTAPIFGWWNAHVGWGTPSGDPHRYRCGGVGADRRAAVAVARADLRDVGDFMRCGRSRWR